MGLRLLGINGVGTDGYIDTVDDLAAGIITATAIALGTTPAAAGILRLPNNTYITARNAANNGDYNILALDGANKVHLGRSLDVSGLNLDNVEIAGGNLSSGEFVIRAQTLVTNATEIPLKLQTLNAAGDAWVTCLTLTPNGAAPSIDLGVDINPGSAGGFKTTLWFYQDNAAASQSAVALTLLGDASRTGAPFPYAGSVIGIVVYSNDARTAGTLTVDATIAGTVTGLQAILNAGATTVKATTQAKDADAFTAGQLIGVKITTDGDWAPTTADIIVGVTVEI